MRKLESIDIILYIVFICFFICVLHLNTVMKNEYVSFFYIYIDIFTYVYNLSLSIYIFILGDPIRIWQVTGAWHEPNQDKCEFAGNIGLPLRQNIQYLQDVCRQLANPILLKLRLMCLKELPTPMQAASELPLRAQRLYCHQDRLIDPKGGMSAGRCEGLPLATLQQATLPPFGEK